MNHGRALALLLLCAVTLVACAPPGAPAPTPAATAIPLPARAGGAAAQPTSSAPYVPPSPTPPAVPPMATPTRVLYAPLPTGLPTMLVPLAPTPAPTQQTAAPAAPPAPITPRLAGRLAVQTSSGGDIMVMNADGSQARVLARGLDPQWSPNGRQIAFTRWTEPQGLYVIDAEGRNERLVHEFPGAKSPTWSPDGGKIAFTWLYKSERREPPRGAPSGFSAQVRDYWRISVIDLASGERTDIALDGDGHAFRPDWGANGQLVYKAVRGLGVVTEKGAPALITDDPQHVSPVWSPDGSKIAFMARQHDHMDIAVINSNGAGLAYLTSAPFVMFTKPPNNTAPAWSPDGRTIVFLSDRDGEWRVYAMNADGSNQRPLFDGISIVYDNVGERVFSWTR